MKILISAYACCPNRGSEPGMAWNWISNIARHCHVTVITSCEFKTDIVTYLPSFQYKENLTFHFIDIGDRATKMGQNQGDWRFYFHYHLWQRKVLKKAVEICALNQIDILHQLNMVGYREPGLLWKIKNKPLVWGPVGGFGGIPVRYLSDFGKKEAFKQIIKNVINKVQIYQPNIMSAIKHANVILAANSIDRFNLQRFRKDEVVLFSEVGTKKSPDQAYLKKDFTQQLQLTWIGKNSSRKALYIALKAMSHFKEFDIKLDVIGVGPDDLSDVNLPDLPNVEFHSWMPHEVVQKKLAQSHLFLFTSLFESTGTVVMEALTYGVPVVCHDTCGQGDVINDRCGIKIPLKTPESSIHGFVEAITKLYNDRQLLQNLSKGALERSMEYTWEHKTLELICCYDKLLKERN